MGYNKWFSRSIDTPVGTNQNERFAERLDSVWFKKPGGGMVRLGHLLTKLIARVDALESSNKTAPVLPMKYSSAGRTATGLGAMNANWRLPQYRPPTSTVVRTTNLIGAVLEGKVLSATIRQDGLKITVEKDNV